MTVIKTIGDFDIAYKGFQYPLPPSWKYAIRQQDQINWLLQALLQVNENGVSSEYLDEQIDQAKSDLTNGYVNADDRLRQYLIGLIAALEDQLDKLEMGTTAQRNPVTGMRNYAYQVSKQIYDMLRTYACTWDELKNTGMTWDELKATAHSWFEVDMFGNIYWGDGEQRAKFTPTDHIDVNSPGYSEYHPGQLAGEAVIAHSWGDMAAFGFLTDKQQTASGQEVTE